MFSEMTGFIRSNSAAHPCHHFLGGNPFENILFFKRAIRHMQVTHVLRVLDQYGFRSRGIGRREKGQYMVTYHDDRKGSDMYWNVSLATRVSRTEALKAGPESLQEFERLFHETFHHCREALERQKNRSPESFRPIHLQYGHDFMFWSD